jgi:2-C-methyl-D-erythritol 4-phosphate cytidylyltransferase
MPVGAVVAAGGSSARMSGRDKTLATVAGRPVIEWVLDAFRRVSGIDELVVVTSDRNRDTITELLEAYPPSSRVRFSAGGETRQDSVASGVRALSSSIDLVLIHDAARPLVTPDLIARAIASGRASGAAVAAVPVTDTIKRVDRSGAVRETLDRAELWAVQTPQVFRRDWLEAAFAKCAGSGRTFTDEGGLIEWAGHTVRVFPGAVENLKLTTASDLIVADALLRARQEPVER